jgi:hypothetical protein
MKGIQGVILSLLIIIHSPFSYFSCFGRPYSLAERVGATVQAIGPAEAVKKGYHIYCLILRYVYKNEYI